MEIYIVCLCVWRYICMYVLRRSNSQHKLDHFFLLCFRKQHCVFQIQPPSWSSVHSHYCSSPSSATVAITASPPQKSTFLPQEFYTNSSSCLKLSCPNLCRSSSFLSLWSEVILILWKVGNIQPRPLLKSSPYLVFLWSMGRHLNLFFPSITISLPFSPNKRIPTGILSVLINDEHSSPRNVVWHWVGIQWERKRKGQGEEKGTNTFINEAEKSLHQRNHHLPNKLVIHENNTMQAWQFHSIWTTVHFWWWYLVCPITSKNKLKPKIKLLKNR